MASDRDHPEVAWDPTKPAFHVMRSDPDVDKVRRQFTKKKVCHLGSDQGCGCGFQRENDWLNDNPKEREAMRENQKRLTDYLKRCLKTEEVIELYGCWCGDEQDEPVRKREISVENFVGEKFFFIGKELIVVRN